MYHTNNCIADDCKPQPALELHVRASPSVEAHHCSVGPDTGRNFEGRQKKDCKPMDSWILSYLVYASVIFFSH